MILVGCSLLDPFLEEGDLLPLHRLVRLGWRHDVIFVIIEGSVPWPGRRRTVTSKPRARSDSASAFIEYGESLSPCSSSAPPTSAAEIELYGRGEKIAPDMDCLCCYLPRCDKQPHCHAESRARLELRVRRTLAMCLSAPLL